MYDDEDRTVATITAYHDPNTNNTLTDQLDSIASIDSDLSNITNIARPSGGANLITEYSYDDDSHMIQSTVISKCGGRR